MNELQTVDNSTLAKTQNAGRRWISPRIKRAVEHMVHDALDMQHAAAQVGISTYRLRQALSQPHVNALLKSELQVLRSARSPKNFHRLCEIADADNNMPAVNAIKALEQIGEETSKSSSAPAPGVTVRIVNVVQSERNPDRQAIDVTSETT